MRVLLVSMPFAALERPALGISLLKAALVSRGVPCDIAYLNLAFASYVGFDDYRAVAKDVPYNALAGEWAFAHCLFTSGRKTDQSYERDVLRGAWGLADDLVGVVRRVHDHAPGFLKRVLEEVAWGSYDVVGFTSFSQQDLGSLALASALHERFPRVAIVFGGGNWQAEIGMELHRSFPFVDYVCSGEADISFPSLVSELQRGDGARPGGIGGIVYRHRGETTATRPGPVVADLDSLPTPDFSDYFTSRVERGCAGGDLPAVVLETSRGCWWAGRDPCLFCGLNGSARGYRTKSPSRILEELRELAGRWPCSLFDVVDNVVSPRFLSEVLRELARRPLPAPIFFETRPQLDREQIAFMGRAHAQIQPGLESLCDHVLSLMHKGTTVLENVRLLKWCREHGVQVFWNMLYGFPGETEDDYRRMIDLLPALHHLEPPGHVGPLRLDRFGQYYRRRMENGLRNVRPLEAYSYVYPFSTRSLTAMAYAFDYDCASDVTRLEDVGSLRTAVDIWQQASDSATLQLACTHGEAVVTDNRDGVVRCSRVLRGLEAALYYACDDIRTRSELRSISAELAGGAGLAEDVDLLLASFVRERLMISDGERFLALAVPATHKGLAR